MNKQNLIFTLLGVLACVSCTMWQTPYSRVADSYAGDSLKQKAAKYLEQYAPYHYGIARHIVDSAGHRSRLKAAQFANDSLYRSYLDDHHYHLSTGTPVMDLDTITDDYLKENIDLAFDSWRKPWSRQIPFEDFCRYILPYRNGDEELTRWRRRFKRRYEHLVTDSLKDTGDIRTVAEFLMRQIRKDIGYGTRFNGLIQGFLTPEETEQLGHLECKACANYAALALRACGIPCQVLEMHWRFTEIPHTSVFVPKTKGNPRAFRIAVGDDFQYMGEPKDSMATWRAWAYSYDVNEDLLELSDDKDVLSSFVRPYCRQDLTSTVNRTFDFSLAVPDSLRSKRHLFLCRFHGSEWYPIREGRVDGDSVRFHDATIRQLYRVGYMDKAGVHVGGGVFTLLGDGRVRPYDQSGQKVLFKFAYSCEPDEDRLTRDIVTSHWDRQGRLVPEVKRCPLWGLNEKTGEYRLFSEDMRGTFKPVFHLCEVHHPMWSAFTSEELPRPVGFLVRDSVTNEGYMMQF